MRQITVIICGILAASSVNSSIIPTHDFHGGSSSSSSSGTSGFHGPMPFPFPGHDGLIGAHDTGDIQVDPVGQGYGHEQLQQLMQAFHSSGHQPSQWNEHMKEQMQNHMGNLNPQEVMAQMHNMIAANMGMPNHGHGHGQSMSLDQTLDEWRQMMDISQQHLNYEVEKIRQMLDWDKNEKDPDAKKGKILALKGALDKMRNQGGYPY